MAALGPQSIGVLPGGGYTVLANKVAYSPKPMGVTIDWTTISANQGRNTIGTISVDATGGTFTLSYGGQTTSAIAEAATAATVQAALQALSTIGVGNIAVTGSAGGPWTYEFVEDLRHAVTTAVTGNGASLTGGTTVVTITAVQAGAADAILTLPGGVTVPIGEKYIAAGSVLYKLGGRKYGVATDATSLVRGECFFNETHILESFQADQVGNVADNGNVIQAALQVGGTAQPTLAAFKTAFPAVRLFTDV